VKERNKRKLLNLGLICVYRGVRVLNETDVKTFMYRELAMFK
jgi:hypothetical protein